MKVDADAIEREIVQALTSWRSDTLTGAGPRVRTVRPSRAAPEATWCD